MTVIDDQMPEAVKRPKPTRRQQLNCFIGCHDWTSRIDLGAEPDKEELESDPVGYFFIFAAPVCRYCAKQLEPRHDF